MARIQILELPMKHVGEYSQTPFALVIDQVETEGLHTSTGVKFQSIVELTQAEAEMIARNVGAVGVILAACTPDVT